MACCYWVRCIIIRYILVNFSSFFLLLISMAHIVQVYIDIYTTFLVQGGDYTFKNTLINVDTTGCSEVLARLLSSMWRGYQSCGSPFNSADRARTYLEKSYDPLKLTCCVKNKDIVWHRDRMMSGHFIFHSN